MKQYLITIDDNDELFIEPYVSEVPEDRVDLCYDGWSGRLFWSNPTKLERVELELDRLLLHEGEATLNDYYDLVGLPQIAIGEEMGWAGVKGVEMRVGSTITMDNRSALDVAFRNNPKHSGWALGKS